MANARRLPSGAWRVLQFDCIRPDGTRKYESFTAPTKEEAEFEAALFALKRGKAAPQTMSVKQCIDNYIALKTPVLSPKTIREYTLVSKLAFASLMTIKIDRLRNEDIQAAVNEYAVGRSPKTVRNALGLVSVALKLAAPEYKIPVTLPRKASPDIQIPDQTQIKALMDACSTTPLYTAILLASSVGLRRSEMCGLLWKDYNMNTHELSISRAVVLNADRIWITKQTKTASSKRKLVVPDFVAEHLDGLKRDKDKIVPLTPDNITCRFTYYRKTLGFTFRFHDLRHYYASLLLALGVPDKYAAQRMGHATTNMLKTVYQHTMQDKEREVENDINKKVDSFFR